MNKFITGHINPDTDSIVSAIALGLYLKKSGIDAESVLIDKMNRETEFVFRYFKEKPLRSIQKALAGAKFYLVDHGEMSQSAPNLKEDDILGVVDHHQMGGIKTIEPIFYRCEVLGSTSTLIVKMFAEKRWDINKKTAGLLLAGIISDTLNLTSKTTTPEDRKALKELSKKTGINIKKFSRELFAAKSDITGMNLENILVGDYKQYNYKEKKIGIGIVETVAIRPFSEKKDRIFKLLSKIKKEKRVDLLFFGLVDILKKETFFYLIADEEAIIASKAFKLKSAPVGDIVIMKGITSRKKQIIPFIFKSI